MEIAKDFDVVRKIKKEFQMIYWNNPKIMSFGLGWDAQNECFTIEVGFIDLESLQQSPIPDTFKGISVVKEVVGEIQAL